MLRVVVEDGESETEAPANLAPDEHLDIAWFGRTELPPLAHHLVRASLLRAARSAAPHD